ncbi:helix-turn-helix domain-containing protein [Nonomuraea lactucae]|uniref:helix-turn-helix domain-containing protein n=1 Tax=Nonomuraea lactucae TaxID=2249762 RepID=UPI0013B3630E|nr:helix-turn-helix transcriptional regulator [Nonomuraea lactucae]
MTMDQEHLRSVLDAVFARQDMEDACKRRDLGGVIRILNKYGVTQGQIAHLTGRAQGRISEYKSGKRIPTAKHTFEEFADGLGMPGPLRRHLGLSSSGGKGGAQVVSDGVQIPTDTFDLQLFAEAIGKRGEPLKRRELLAMVGQLGAQSALAQSEAWEKVAFALSRPSAIDEAVVREMEARAAGFHRLEEMLPAHTIFKGLAAHLNQVGTILNGTATDPKDELRRRLIVVAGESSVLAGWIATDLGNISAARNFYDTAEKASKEADDPAIIACAFGYRSYIPSGKGNHGRARALLATALQNLPEDTSPGTTSWLAARHAEESAALGEKEAALQSWDQAREAFNIADPEEDRVWTRFLDQDRFDSFRISTYAQIGRLDEAEAVARAVIARMPEVERKRAGIILGDIATAHIMHGSAKEAARAAREGLAIIRETESGIWLPRFLVLGEALRRWQTQPPVRAFLEELAVTKRQFSASPR